MVADPHGVRAVRRDARPVAGTPAGEIPGGVGSIPPTHAATTVAILVAGIQDGAALVVTSVGMTIVAPVVGVETTVAMIGPVIIDAVTIGPVIIDAGMIGQVASGPAVSGAATTVAGLARADSVKEIAPTGVIVRVAIGPANSPHGVSRGVIRPGATIAPVVESEILTPVEMILVATIPAATSVVMTAPVVTGHETTVRARIVHETIVRAGITHATTGSVISVVMTRAGIAGNLGAAAMTDGPVGSVPAMTGILVPVETNARAQARSAQDRPGKTGARVDTNGATATSVRAMATSVRGTAIGTSVPAAMSVARLIVAMTEMIGRVDTRTSQLAPVWRVVMMNPKPLPTSPRLTSRVH